MLTEKIRSLIKDATSWIILGLIVGVPIGLASSLFLFSLDFITQFRENNLWLIALLPIVGLFIGFLYQRFGKTVEGGNNVIFSEYFIPKKTLHFFMAPLILVTTLLTHLVGGSAGREGTALQMGAAIADRFHFLGIKFQQNRSLFLMAGVGAGFASLFGTPWAGAIFTLEILRNKNTDWHGLVPAVITSFVAYYTCLITQAPHTHYNAVPSIDFGFSALGYLGVAGLIFGLSALLYIRSHDLFKILALKLFPNPIWRPFYGGIVLFLAFVFIGNSRFMGLGIPTIMESFEQQIDHYDFLIKLFLTAFTLAFGFKGGEVTPLFFIGATLGSALTIFLPLPISFMAALGFLAVFAGSTKTFLACSIMGVELFGWDAFPYFILVCFIAQIFSGKKSIYAAQPKNHISLF